MLPGVNSVKLLDNGAYEVETAPGVSALSAAGRDKLLDRVLVAADAECGHPRRQPGAVLLSATPDSSRSTPGAEPASGVDSELRPRSSSFEPNFTAPETENCRPSPLVVVRPS